MAQVEEETRLIEEIGEQGVLPKPDNVGRALLAYGMTLTAQEIEQANTMDLQQIIRF